MSYSAKRIATHVLLAKSLNEEEIDFLKTIAKNPSRTSSEIISIWKRANNISDSGSVINILRAKGLIIEDLDLELYMLTPKGDSFLRVEMKL